MSTFYPQAYDVSASGFYFESNEELKELSAKARNKNGFPVEEFEIQFVDGKRIDAALAEAVGVHQGDLAHFFEREVRWSEYQKQAAIIAKECGYHLDLDGCDPDRFVNVIYELDSLREVAVLFVDEGLIGDIPEHLAGYIDYDAVARDLAVDHMEACIAGTKLIYSCR